MNGRRILVAGVAAIVAASGAGTFVALIVSGGFNLLLPVVFVIGLLVAARHFLLLGLPFSLLMIAHGRVRWWSMGLAGLLIGAVPIPLLTAWGRRDLDTLALTNQAPAALFLGLAGLVGGLAFRASYGLDEDAE